MIVNKNYVERLEKKIKEWEHTREVKEYAKEHNVEYHETEHKAFRK